MTPAPTPFRHLGLWIVQIAENDRPGRTRGLARGHHFAVADIPVLLVGGRARAFDALDAIGAFLHHAARAHSDVGVVRGVRRRTCWLAVVEPIEASHLIGAVARTGARTDAAVVDHLVEAFG